MSFSWNKMQRNEKFHGIHDVCPVSTHTIRQKPVTTNIKKVIHTRRPLLSWISVMMDLLQYGHTRCCRKGWYPDSSRSGIISSLIRLWMEPRFFILASAGWPWWWSSSWTYPWLTIPLPMDSLRTPSISMVVEATKRQCYYYFCYATFLSYQWKCCSEGLQNEVSKLYIIIVVIITCFLKCNFK